MSRLSRISLIPTLIALAASGALAGPKVLSDAQMGEITAGTTSSHPPSMTAATGGTIVANESDASVVDSASVSLQENTQIDARALSLVSAADALVANGVNLWDGALQDLSVGSEIDVSQSNELSQSATLPHAWLLDYERDAERLRDVQTFADSTVEPQKIDFQLQLDIPEVGSFDGRAEVPAAVIPGAKIPGSFGNVVGFAGELGIEFDGGAFEAGFSLDSSVAAKASLDAETETSILWGLINLGGTVVQSSTEVSAHFNPYVNIAMELPDLSILGEGAVCYANGGECRSSVLEREIGALDVGLARAEYVVIDRSALEASESFRIDLGPEAQANARAVALVNSAGGLVANGANVATVNDTSFLAEDQTSGVGSLLSTPILNLVQGNTVLQERGHAPGEAHSYGDRHGEKGSNPGGAIVANESEANLTQLASVSAADAAQTGARAINLVNSAQALVANGVNVWDGRLQDGSFGNRADVQQDNDLAQTESLSAASLTSYERGAETLHHVTTYANSSSTPKSLGTEFTLEILPGADEPVATLTGKLDIPASIIPTSKIPGVGGTVAAFAGNVDVDLDGGHAHFGTGVDAGLHFVTDNHVEGSTGDFGLFTLTAAGTADLDNTIDVTVDAELDLFIDMPDLELAVDGAVCFAQKGSCEAGVTDRVLGAVELDSADAEYMALDRSMLEVDATNSIELDTGAQADARAVTLVNAAGGSVANGVNIASWRGDESLLETPTLNLAQRNTVTQASESGREPAAGVIVANESTADVSGSAFVVLNNGAQAGARGLSLVNSAAATVANGINVWAGNLTEAAFDKSVNVAQDNLLAQQSLQAAARLRDYERGAERLRDVQTAATTKSATDAGDDFFPVAKSGEISGEVDLQIRDLVNFDRTGHVPTSIIPTSKIPGGKPGALAFAGDAFVHYDGGAVNLDFFNENTFKSTTTADARGAVTGFFGIIEGSGGTTYTENLSADLTTNLHIGVDMPDLTIDVEGAGCISKGSDCTSSVLEKETGALDIAHATAEHIVVDRSSLNAADDHSVSLGDSAQADAQALLLVNSAGGLVANGLNVASVASLNLSTPQLNLVQSNIVLQGGEWQGEQRSQHRRGSPAGGVIVGNESEATLTSVASVSLDQFAQDGARALAIVNAADALVGNGINVWDGDLNQADFSNSINVQQINQVLQNASPAVARLYGYRRDDQELRDVRTSADSRATPQFIKAGFAIDVLPSDDPTLGSLFTYSEGLIVPAAAIPNSKIPGAKGVVAGFAGKADVFYGGGHVDAVLGIDGNFAYNNKTIAEAGVMDFLGFGQTSGMTTFAIDDFSVNFAPEFFLHADLPTLNIEAEGALCWANGGTCSAGILEREIGDLDIKAASGEHVVVDHGRLNATESYSVALGNGAQANARAMAIVNAAGGLVGNGVNVSTFRGASLTTPALNLVQRNVVVQGR